MPKDETTRPLPLLPSGTIDDAGHSTEDEADRGGSEVAELTSEDTLHTLQMNIHEAETETFAAHEDYQELQLKYAQLIQAKERELSESRALTEKASMAAQNLLANYRDVEAELTECKNVLFDLQAPNQITDSEIAKQWEALCRSIEHWVDKNTNPERGSIQTQFDNFSRSRKKFTAANLKTFNSYWTTSSFALDERYENIFEPLIHLHIHRLLERSVFDKKQPMIGLKNRTADIVDDIEYLMAKVVPRRSAASIATWKSEALTALCTAPEYAQMRHAAAVSATAEGRVLLSPLVSERSSGAFEAFMHDVVDAAIVHDRFVRQSSISYHYAFGSQSQAGMSARPEVVPPREAGVVSVTCFQTSDVMDMVTRKRFTSKNPLVPDAKGNIGWAITTVYPALYCHRGERDILLSKQLLLVEVFDSSRPKVKATVKPDDANAHGPTSSRRSNTS